jgi:hypothetical protein
MNTRRLLSNTALSHQFYNLRTFKYSCILGGIYWAVFKVQSLERGTRTWWKTWFGLSICLWEMILLFLSRERYMHYREWRLVYNRYGYHRLSPISPVVHFIVYSNGMLNGSVSPRYCSFSGCGWRRRPQDVEGSREYTEQAIAGSLQGVVLQLCGWAGAHNSSPQRIACCEMLHLVGPCEHGNELSGSIEGGEFLTSWVTVSCWRRTLLHGVS